MNYTLSPITNFSYFEQLPTPSNFSSSISGFLPPPDDFGPGPGISALFDLNPQIFINWTKIVEKLSDLRAKLPSFKKTVDGGNSLDIGNLNAKWLSQIPSFPQTLIVNMFTFLTAPRPSSAPSVSCPLFLRLSQLLARIPQNATIAILMRHGPRDAITTDHPHDQPLNTQGIDAMQALGEFYRANVARLGTRQLRSSPSARCIQTLQTMFPNQAINTDPALDPLSLFATQQGKEEEQKLLGLFKNQFSGLAIPFVLALVNGEITTIKPIASIVQDLLSSLLQRATDGSSLEVVANSHDLILAAVVNYLLRIFHGGEAPLLKDKLWMPDFAHSVAFWIDGNKLHFSFGKKDCSIDLEYLAQFGVNLTR